MAHRPALPALLTCCALLLGCPAEPDDDDDTTAPADDDTTDEPVEITYKDPTQQGPFAVGVREELLYDPELGIDTPLEVWYPAEPTDGESAWPGSIGVRDADVDPGEAPYPVVVFSHGHRALRYQSYFWCDRLASHGYVVAAPDHEFNTVFDYEEEATAQVAIDRPRDVSATLDWLIDVNTAGNDPLRGLLDTDRAAVAGHSFGGWTAAVVGGWVVESLPLVTEEELEELGIEFPQDMSDERFATAISMTPAGPSFMGTDGLDQIRMPILYFGGELDAVCPPEEEVVPMYEHSPDPRTMVMIADTGHYGISNMCDFLPGMFDDCGDDHRPATEVHDITNAYSLDQLGLYVREDDRYGELLAEEPPPFEGVEVSR
jgi:predicted dienelactone hydrolase